MKQAKLRRTDAALVRLVTRLRDALPSRAELARLFNVHPSTIDRTVDEKIHKTSVNLVLKNLHTEKPLKTG